MLFSDSLPPPVSSSLDNPLYYRENGLAVINWVLDRHSDLLLADEIQRLAAFKALPVSAQALLLRMVMRAGELFRVSNLEYAELPDPRAAALGMLIEGGWLDPEPLLSVTALERSLRREEWLAMLQEFFAERPADNVRLTRSTSKRALVAAWSERWGEMQRPLLEWWPGATEQIVAVEDMPLFDRVRLMFFGNLRQSWSEFVGTELGYQRYESVPLSRESRAFQSRHDVDHYFRLHQCREELGREDTDLRSLWATIPLLPDDLHPWLGHRHRRLIFQLGHAAERAGQLDLALTAYRRAWSEEARVRYFRVAEKSLPPGTVLSELEPAYRRAASPTEKQSLGRVLTRLARRSGRALPPRTERLRVPEQTLYLRSTGLPVEWQVAEALQGRGAVCHYVENTLFTGLLGLLFWPAIYAPLPGAFFHPFQAAPADLWREGFLARRTEEIGACLDMLDTDTYRDQIRHIWRTRQGVACPLVVWPVLSEELVELALSCIPASDLKAIFGHMLGDLRSRRSGLPDLIRFWPSEQRYELIEVKAPGDRVQDNQRLWLEFLVAREINAQVCHVRWQEGL